MATSQDITIKQNARFQIVGRVQIDGADLDLTDAETGAITFRVGKRGDPDAIEYIYDADTPAEITITDAATGAIKIISGVGDTDIVDRTYDWEIWVTHGNLDDAVICGDFTIQRSLDGEDS